MNRNLPHLPNNQGVLRQTPSPRYARDAVVRLWRWLCHRATTPRQARDRRDPRPCCFRLCKTGGGAGGRDGLRRKKHPEPLPSLDDRSAPQAFHQNPAQRPGLALHYQCRDYAPLQSRSLCLVPGDRGRTARPAVAAGGSCVMRARTALTKPRPIPGSPRPEQAPNLPG
jgi:hypothetical protein